MNSAGQGGAGGDPPDITAGTEQPVEVLASWIAHVLEREMDGPLDHLLDLCRAIEVQLAAWPRSALPASIETAAAAVASIDHQDLHKTRWWERLLTGRQMARHAQFATAARAALAGVTELKSLNAPLLSKHPAHLSGTRRVMLELSMAEEEVRQRLVQVASWHAQLWQVLLQRRATETAATETERTERLFRLVERWGARIEQANGVADAALGVAQAAQAVLAARSNMLETCRTQLCSCEAEWSARLVRLIDSLRLQGGPTVASRSVQELNARMEVALHELVGAAAAHAEQEEVFSDALQQVEASRPRRPGSRSV